MNSSSKSKSKKSDKSPKTKLSSSDSTTKGSASDSSHGTNSPISRTPSASTPADSPSQASSQPAVKKQESSSADSVGGSTAGGTNSQGGATTANQTSVTTTTTTTTASASLLSPSAIKPSPTLWFTTEIQQMMYGFGDCRKPLAESASLIEEIVHQQMTSLLYNAEDVARMRSARFIGIEDFLFLLRKDKIKLRRLLRYMAFKDIKQHALKASVDDEDTPEQAADTKQPMTKRQKICYDFLSTIDQTGELVALTDDFNTDEVKHERALRAELQTRTMDSQQYLEFCEARQVSFTPRYKIQKFKDWLVAGVTLDIKPNPLAMEVLSYMAYETVAQVVDLTLLVKQDQRGSVDNPFSLTTSAVCINHEVPQSAQNSEGLLTTAAAAGLKSPSAVPTTPSSSPPPTPTTPVNLGSSSGLSQSNSSLGSSGSKSKSKKKKKSSSSSSRDVFTAQAITPNDIREAMRRYGQCIGPFADFSKCVLFNPNERLLCC